MDVDGGVLLAQKPIWWPPRNFAASKSGYRYSSSNSINNSIVVHTGKSLGEWMLLRKY